MRDRVASLSLSQFKWRPERDHAWRRLPITQIRAFDTLSMKVMHELRDVSIVSIGSYGSRLR